MLDTAQVGEALQQQGFHFYVGVPCSYLKPLINYAINECDYIAANNEGDAVAIGCGAHLGGKKAVFLCQNSGLSNATSPLSSLNHPFAIPLLGFMSLRGDPNHQDEPQHQLVGRITLQLLDALNIAWQYLSDDVQTARQQIAYANQVIEQNKSFFFIVKKGTFSDVALMTPPSIPTPKPIGVPVHRMRHQSEATSKPYRHHVISALLNAQAANNLMLSTTGYTSRELYQLGDASPCFYMVGSMGCLPALGLGVAISAPQHPVTLIDGDGALLMRLGALAINAYYQPANLCHVVLNNQAYESTGAQVCVGSDCAFSEVASALGYPQTLLANSLDDLIEGYRHWQANPVLTLIQLDINCGTLPDLKRPTLSMPEIKARFMQHIQPPAPSAAFTRRFEASS